MSSEKSKTVEEQLRFSSLIWSAVRLVDYPRRICLSKPKSFIRSWHPIKASYYLYIAFRLAKNRVSFRRNLNAASVHVFDRRSSCCLDENDFSTNFWKSFGDSIGRAVFVSFRFVSSRNNNNLEGKTDRSTVLTFSLFLLLRFIATSR